VRAVVRFGLVRNLLRALALSTSGGDGLVDRSGTYCVPSDSDLCEQVMNGWPPSPAPSCAPSVNVTFPSAGQGPMSQEPSVLTATSFGAEPIPAISTLLQCPRVRSGTLSEDNAVDAGCR